MRAERRPGFVAQQIDASKIIHVGAPQPPVRPDESARPDDIDPDAQARRQPENRAGILRDVRFVKGKTHESGNDTTWRRSAAGKLCMDGAIRLYPLAVARVTGLRGRKMQRLRQVVAWRGGPVDASHCRSGRADATR